LWILDVVRVAQTFLSVPESQAGMPVLHWGEGEDFIQKFYKRLLLIFILV